MPQTLLITGANRGIGLALTRLYAQEGWQIHACCRHPEQADDLLRLAGDYPGLSLHALDVAESDQIRTLARQLSGPIDILCNNAGIYGPADTRFGHTDEQAWLECLRVNCIAPMKMAEAFVEQLASSQRKTLANLTSKMGSMADNGSGGSYLYRSSKAALNAVMKSAALDLRPRGIKVALLHPGWVKTDMGGPNAEIRTAQSASQMRTILEQMRLEDSGTFYDIDGSLIPW